MVVLGLSLVCCYYGVILYFWVNYFILSVYFFYLGVNMDIWYMRCGGYVNIKLGVKDVIDCMGFVMG